MSPELLLLTTIGDASVLLQSKDGCDGRTPGLPILAWGCALGWVKTLQKLLLVDFSHLIAWDLLHHDQLGWDGVRCHGLPALQKHTPLQLTDQRFQPLHPTEPILRPHEHHQTWGGSALGPCVLQPDTGYN